MREILFRGKCAQGKEWKYGYFFAKPILEKYFIELGNEMWQVDQSTVGQYTGLTDKNGEKIFEGDICYFTVFDCFDNDTQYRGVVVYSGSRFMLWKSVGSEYYGADGGFDLDWVIAQDDEFEIVGNIHDTPELLKEASNAPPN